MDRPDFRTLPYDLGNELEDLKKYKEDLEKQTKLLVQEQLAFLERYYALSKQLRNYYL